MKNRIFGFDLLRAIAIMLVMFGHSLHFIYPGIYTNFLSFLSGFLGVEIFFVLSGVLIGKILINIFEKNDLIKNLKTFLVRRWLRTLPLYFVMLAVYYFGNKYFDSFASNDVEVWKYIFFLQNFYEVQPTFFGISWSLSIEEWFYLLFPFVLCCLRNSFQRISVKRLFLLGVFSFVFYFLLMRFLNLSENSYHFYEGVRKIAFFRLDAISFGILTAWLLHFYQGQTFRKRKLLLILGIVVLAINQYLIFKDNYSNLTYFNTGYFSVLGIGLGLLFPFFKNLRWSESNLTKSIVFTSKISYSLYLVHWLVARGLDWAVFSGVPAQVKFFLFFLLSFIAAALLYYIIEKPVLKFRNRNYHQ